MNAQYSLKWQFQQREITAMLNATFRNVARISACVFMLSATASAFAACPGYSAVANIKTINVASGAAATMTNYISVDATAGASVDVCGCRTGSNILYLYRSETTPTEAMKAQLALVMEAKALNKRISYKALDCLAGAGSGFVTYTEIVMEE